MIVINEDGRYFRCRSQVRACLVPAVHAPAILPACGPGNSRRWRLTRLSDGRRHFGRGLPGGLSCGGSTLAGLIGGPLADRSAFTAQPYGCRRDQGGCLR